MSVEYPKIALIGGGTGSFTLLQELKKVDPTISAIVNMSDDGGSTGVLRDELGVLPPGDVRQCLVALSDSPEVRDMFNYRFGEGRLAGQSLGNMMLSGLELQHGSFAKAVKIASKIMNISGQVIPVTLDQHELVMNDDDNVIKGEYVIAHHEISKPEPTLWLEPSAHINPEAKDAIDEADLIVIAPGNLYGSLLPIFAVEGVAEALKTARGQKVTVSNLVTKPGQTDGWHVMDYVNEQERFIGTGVLDAVLYNSRSVPSELVMRYAADGELPVRSDVAGFKGATLKLLGAKLVADQITTGDPNDKVIQRTLIRHDPVEVAKQLVGLVQK